jgi:hypothetical protein
MVTLREAPLAKHACLGLIQLILTDGGRVDVYGRLAGSHKHILLSLKRTKDEGRRTKADKDKGRRTKADEGQKMKDQCIGRSSFVIGRQLVVRLSSLVVKM